MADLVGNPEDWFSHNEAHISGCLIIIRDDVAVFCDCCYNPQCLVMLAWLSDKPPRSELMFRRYSLISSRYSFKPFEYGGTFGFSVGLQYL